MTTGVVSDHPNASLESKVDFHSTTVLVRVPIVVVDKNGNHVPGLTQSDFEVLENGKAQKLATFEEFQSPTHPPNSGSAASASDFAATAKPADISVIVLDTVNTPFLDQAYGRKELIRYLASNIDGGQSLALVLLTSKGVRVLQAPTRDSTALIAAVNRLKGELSTMEDTDIDMRARAFAESAGDFPASNQASPTEGPYADLRRFVVGGDSGIAHLQQDGAIEATMRGFLEISWGLSGFPGRKSLIWATGSFPFYIDSPGAIPGGRLSALYERTLQAMNDAQISVYPVDVRGLLNTSPNADARARLRPGSDAARQVSTRAWLQASMTDTLRDFADMTGGKAFYNTNDLATSFRRAAADSASYYLVSYYLDTANRNPGWRSLKVKVQRKGVEVRSRQGFFVTNAAVNPELSRQSDIAFAMNSQFDSTGVPFSVQWTGISTPSIDPGTAPGISPKKVGFLLRVGGTGVSIESGASNRLNLDLLAFAFTGIGQAPAAKFAKNFEVDIPDKQLPQLREKGLGYSNTLDLPPGEYKVRFVVRDNFNGRIGSVSVPVTVK